MIKFFNPGLGYAQLKDEMLPEIDRVLTKGDLILRDDVEKFEKSVAEFVGTKYAVAVNSCTDALYLALRAVDVGPRDEVLVPSRTFVATPQVVVQLGATPVFYDIDSDLESLVTLRTRAIMPVHIEGHFDEHMDQIMDLAERYGIFVVEDAAQAFGAVKDGKKAGSIGDVGCFSFYPAKTLGAYGDAGAVVTNDEEIYNYIKNCRNHFSKYARSGEREFLPNWGINSRLDNLQAAILNVKFKHYDKALARRKEIAEKYDKELPKELELPKHIEGRIWQDYIVRTPERDALYEFLKAHDIETLKNNYPFPVPKLPLAQAYEDETLRLPCNELLTDDEVDTIIKTIKKYYE